MIARWQRLPVVIMILAIGASCGASSGQNRDSAVVHIDGALAQDGGDPLPDLYEVRDGPPPDGGNSGQICSASSPSCPNDSEICLLLEWGAARGMCLGRCHDRGDPCPVPDPATMNSVCIFGVQGGSNSYCGFLCEVQGKSFNCPNSVDYKCEVLFSSMPELKFCIPQ